MKGFKKDGTARFSDGEELGAMIDNVLASRLGKVWLAARKTQRGGDSIDNGLTLLRLLKESGFEVRETQ